jgi:NitT/TauT family transport system permease protein
MSNRWRNIIDPALLLIAVALLWEYAVDIFGIKRYLLPPLSDVLRTFWSSKESLALHSLVTGREVLYGFMLSVLVGVTLGLATYASSTLKRTLYPALIILQGIPKIALAPLILIWLGYGEPSKVFMAFLFAVFPVVVSTLGGLAGTPAHLDEHFRAMRASKWATFFRLQVPSALPSILDGCKTAMPLAVIGAVVGEFVGAERGLGYILMEASGQAKTDVMFAALLAICIVAGLFSLLIEVASKKVWWRAL